MFYSQIFQTFLAHSSTIDQNTIAQCTVLQSSVADPYDFVTDPDQGSDFSNRLGPDPDSSLCKIYTNFLQ
jgi:hypothetical protein